MKKNIPLWLVNFVVLFIVSGSPYEAKGQDVKGVWNGRVSFTEKFSGLTGSSERDIDITISENRVTGSHTYFGKLKIGDNYFGETNCNVADSIGELHAIIINESDSTYRIEIISPSCTGTSISALDGTSTPYGPEQKDIIITDKRLGANHNILSGTETTINDVIGSGKLTTTITWSLVNGPIDAELIVIPQNYDNWLPVPGKNELTKGSVMNITLKVQRRNGQPATLKAKSFDLRLSNTSKEPGITLNAPLIPSSDQLPDLRFLPYSVAESVDEDQFTSIACNNGSTGKVQIGSYDGGGWTTLTAEAILEDGTRIKGTLLVSGGDTEIPIPKRNPGTKIASSWLAANGGPGEMDDKETSAKGNTNDGDGLTAYEEYRGVISQRKFIRLDPNKKEVGVRVDRAQFPLFSQGVKWFENASGLNVIRFDEFEIPNNRRFNQNASSAHIYDQYVLILYKGLLDWDERELGSIFSYTRKPAIPEFTISVVIDIDAVHREYNGYLTTERPARLPFTEAEFLANVVAHELGHGVNIWHHGQKPDLDSARVANILRADHYRIFGRNGLQIARPYTVNTFGGVIGQSGNTESGDLNCIMAYNPYCKWAYTIGADGASIFNEVPLLPIGNKMCNTQEGTGINATAIYFGDAPKGKCLSQIKLKP